MAKTKRTEVDKYMDMVAGLEDAASQMEYGDVSFPDDGEYTVIYERLQCRDYTDKDGVDCLSVQPRFRILNEEDRDAPLADYPWRFPVALSESDDTPFGFRKFMTFASCVAGKELRSAREALKAVYDGAGQTVVQLEIYTSKNGKYQNIRWKDATPLEEDEADGDDD